MTVEIEVNHGVDPEILADFLDMKTQPSNDGATEATFMRDHGITPEQMTKYSRAYGDLKHDLRNYESE